MNSKMKILYITLVAIITLSFYGCGLSPFGSNEKKPEVSEKKLAEKNEDKKTDSNREKLVRTKRASINTNKTHLDNLLRSSENIHKVDIKQDIGPKTITKVSEICSKVKSNSKDKAFCTQFKRSTNDLTEEINVFCNLAPEVCKQEIEEKNSTIKYFNELCEEGSRSQFGQCGELQETMSQLDALIQKQKEEILQKQNGEDEKEETKGKKPEEEDFSFLSLFLYILGGIALMGIIGGLGWLIWTLFPRSTKDKQVRERELTQKGFGKFHNQNQQINKSVSELKKLVKILNDKCSDNESKIESLERKFSQLSSQVFVEQDFNTPQSYQPEPKFPVSVEDYRVKNRNNIQQEATANPIGGTLTNDLSNGNEFVIVKDSELENGFYYAIPNQDRFASKSEYSNYQKYYDFDNPSGGTLWIRKPATVRQIEGGWKLYEKGKLEVR